MYKIAHDLAQRRSRQLWLKDLQGKAWDELPLEDQKANIRRKLDPILKQYDLDDSKEEKKELGLVINELNRKIGLINKQIKGQHIIYRAGDVPQAFIDVVKERVTLPVFNIYMKEALRRAEQNLMLVSLNINSKAG